MSNKSIFCSPDFLRVFGFPWSSSEFLGVPRSSSEFLGVPRSSSEFLGVPRSSSEFIGVPRSSSEFLFPLVSNSLIDPFRNSITKENTLWHLKRAGNFTTQAAYGSSCIIILQLMLSGLDKTCLLNYYCFAGMANFSVKTFSVRD